MSKMTIQLKYVIWEIENIMFIVYVQFFKSKNDEKKDPILPEKYEEKN